MTAGGGRRRSDRINRTMSVEVRGTDADGRPFVEAAHTVVVSRHGAAIALKHKPAHDQELLLRRPIMGRANRLERARVVGKIDGRHNERVVCLALIDPAIDFWEIEFPSAGEAEGALARMLIECGCCQSLELAYLNELEIRVFATHQGVARHCKRCGAPTIWKQARHEDFADVVRSASAPAPTPSRPGSTPHERSDPRLMTRLSGCIRLPGREEDMVVCENMSRGGLCFRSRARYPEGIRIEIAVPFSQGAANVFVPAEIVHIQELASVRLFRHGVQYSYLPTEQPVA